MIRLNETSNETQEGINRLIKGFNTEHLDTIGKYISERTMAGTRPESK